MSKRIHGSFVSIICSLVLIFSAATSAQAQDTYELRCRGGAKAFVIDQVSGNTLSLYFTASTTAAGTAGEGLEPGKCAWIDRAINQAEPKQIQFSASGSDRPAMTTHLSDPNNYWSFFVFNSGKGYFEAKSHRASATNADIVAGGDAITGADVTTGGSQTTKNGVVGRRPGLDPTGPQRRPTAEKQIRTAAMAIQFFRDVKVDDVTPDSFTLSYTTFEPARSQVLVALWTTSSVDGGKSWYQDPNVKYDRDGFSLKETYWNTNHRITIRLQGNMAAGQRRQLSISAMTSDARSFEYKHIFTTP